MSWRGLHLLLDSLLKGVRMLCCHGIPGLAGAHVMIVDAVEVEVLDVPGECGEKSAVVEHRCCDARDWGLKKLDGAALV